MHSRFLVEQGRDSGDANRNSRFTLCCFIHPNIASPPHHCWMKWHSAFILQVLWCISRLIFHYLPPLRPSEFFRKYSLGGCLPPFDIDIENRWKQEMRSGAEVLSNIIESSSMKSSIKNDKRNSGVISNSRVLRSSSIESLLFLMRWSYAFLIKQHSWDFQNCIVTSCAEKRLNNSQRHHAIR